VALNLYTENIYILMYPVNLLIEIICLLFALLLLRKNAGFWRYFKVYMFLTVLIETTGWLMRFHWKISNQWLYNIFSPVQVLFLYWIFAKLYPGQAQRKRLMGICVLVFALVYLFECFYFPFTLFYHYSWIVFSFLIIITCGLYYFFLLRDEPYIHLATDPSFWFVTGVFVYFFCSSVCTLFFTELVRINIAQNISLRYLLFIVFNFILYGCWSYAFLCRYKQTTSSS